MLDYTKEVSTTILILLFSFRNKCYYYFTMCTRWRSWLRHCATSREVASSIPDGVTGIFHCHNNSGRTMALGLTQSLTEMSKGKVIPLQVLTGPEGYKISHHCLLGVTSLFVTLFVTR
jgi:hypothetical protein